MISIEKALEYLEKNKSDNEFFDSLNSKFLEVFEGKMRICLPDDYKLFLMFSNGGELFIPGTTLYSYFDADIFSSLNRINDIATINLENKFSIPKSYLIIGRLNFGDLICIDTKGEGNVIQWDHEQNVEYMHWISFSKWLSDAIEDFEEYLKNDDQ